MVTEGRRTTSDFIQRLQSPPIKCNGNKDKHVNTPWSPFFIFFFCMSALNWSQTTDKKGSRQRRQHLPRSSATLTNTHFLYLKAPSNDAQGHMTARGSSARLIKSLPSLFLSPPYLSSLHSPPLVPLYLESLCACLRKGKKGLIITAWPAPFLWRPQTN